MFETGDNGSSENMRMSLVKKIDAILNAREQGWADLARLMDLSPQRVNNWRIRGVPAAQIRHIEAALGLKRYALDEDATAVDETSAAIAEFSRVYRAVTAEGRRFLRDTVAFVERSFVATERRTKQLSVVKDRRNKA